MKPKHLLFGLFLCLSLFIQTAPSLADVLFPGQSGADLLEEINQNYQPQRHLGYGDSRDILYRYIDNQDGGVSGIYTNFTVPFDPDSTSDPSQTVYRGGDGINAEHIWPQSKGADGIARDDQHNLFPSYPRVNSSRGNKPFAEIPDEQTMRWYLDDERQSTIPDPGVIDEYSESTSDTFEPREDRKGDVARAMFYFLAIYPDDADQSFFNDQQDTLCQWNELDPVDERELERNQAIAEGTAEMNLNGEEVQGNYNPFILDDTLAQRTFCD